MATAVHAIMPGLLVGDGCDWRATHLLGGSASFTLMSSPLEVVPYLGEVFGLSCSDELHRY